MAQRALCMIVSLLLQAEYLLGGFLGGTASWMPIPHAGQIRLTYRLSWEAGTGPCGPGCSMADIGKLLHPSIAISSLHWTTLANNATTVIGDVSYVVTSVSLTQKNGWESGENALTLSNNGSSGYIFRLSNIPWVSNGNTSVAELGQLQTTVDTRTRGDTGTANSSPYISVPPFVGIPFECQSVIWLPVEDPDGDRVRCRWAAPGECGQACSNTPTGSVWLDQATCTVTINAFNKTGYLPDTVYRLALTVQDYSRYRVQVGSEVFTNNRSFSQVPVQLSVRVVPGPCNSQSMPEFVVPTPRPFSRVSYGVMDFIRHTPVNVSFYIQAQNIGLLQFMVSGPMYMVYEYLGDDLSVALNRSDVARISSIWRPQRTQFGPQQFCVWGVDMLGITTQSRCITELVADNNFCSTSANCYNNGTCVNIYNIADESCACLASYRGRNCSQKVYCHNHPCENNGTCISNATGFTCTCMSGYTGIHCETKIAPCWSSPCRNNATCLDMAHGYMCLCTANYTGIHCNVQDGQISNISSISNTTKGHEDKTVSNENSTPWTLIAIAGGCMLGLALVAATCAILKTIPICPGKVTDVGKSRPSADIDHSPVLAIDNLDDI